MEQDYSAAILTYDEKPVQVYHATGRHNASRREYKRQLLLTFIDHAATPRQKHNETAPIKPTLLSTVLAILLK